MTECRNKRFAACCASNWREFLGLPAALLRAKPLFFVQDWKVLAALFALLNGLWFRCAWEFMTLLSGVQRVVVDVVHQLKVFNPVVVFGVVDVVNNFFTRKRPSDVRSHDHYMLLNVALCICVLVRLVMNKNVSIFNYSTNPLMVILVAVKNAVMKIFALFRTIVIFPFSIPRGMSFIRSGAVVTGCGNHGQALDFMGNAKYITLREVAHFSEDGK